MTVAAGSKLGPYEMLAPLGAGGMGEVWRARDTRLDRSVAIKILPQAFSSDSKSRLRFEREAKAISQLNHPNICSLYDVGHDSGTDYLVMELMEGESLADRIARGGALPLAEVIRFGAQIADALHAAHRQGIVHRDLKPGNIMLTRTGAKLLDFGLARTAESAASQDGPTAAFTAQRPLTEEGTIVGTIQYMSPEQLTGNPADHRSDIFALGVVLYEMVTGRRAFPGSTRTSVVSAIIAAQPAPLSSVQPLAPRSLERAIAACIAKDPDDRLQSAHDVGVQLRWLEGSGEEDRPSAAVRRPWLAWSIAALSALAALAMLGVLSVRDRGKAPVPPIRFTISPPPQTNFSGMPAISADGTRVVLNAQSADGKSMLWLRTLDRLEVQPIKGSENGSFAFWSPDGQQIGFTARGKLWRFHVADNTVHAICDVPDDLPGGATWNRNGVIVFSSGGALHRISASGGAAVRLSVTRPGESTNWPWFLPDDDHFLFDAQMTKDHGIYAGSLSSNVRKLILKSQDIVNSRVAYAAGYIFYNRGPELYAQKFDADRLELTGEPEKIDDNVEFYAPGRSAFSVSQTGTLVYHPASDPVVDQLAFVDRAGVELASVGPLAAYDSFELSPDDRRLVFTRWGAVSAAWMLDIARGSLTRLSFEPWSGFPYWTADGRSIVYAAAVDTPPNLFLRTENGSIQRLTTMAADHYPTDVTPDGKSVIAEITNPPNGMDTILVPLAAPNRPVSLIATKFDDREAVVSPDGAWLAYESDESGEWQVYVTRLTPGGSRVQISTTTGLRARWSRDGRRLYYVDMSQKKLMEVTISTVEGELEPSLPAPLFPYDTTNYDVTRDGRFLIARRQLNPNAAPMHVFMNWLSTVR
jgi:eukaryotic-like serine/threonine-protein kinase